jgi:hypothetical protein
MGTYVRTCCNFVQQTTMLFDIQDFTNTNWWVAGVYWQVNRDWMRQINGHKEIISPVQLAVSAYETKYYDSVAVVHIERTNITADIHTPVTFIVSFEWMYAESGTTRVYNKKS